MKRLLVGGAVLALGIGGMNLAQAAQGYKVTGGGQIIAEGASGPGDTLAFNARSLDGQTAAQDSDGAQGQLQYNGRGDAAQKFHGLVTCLQVEGTVARIAGIKKTETGETGFFRLVLDDTDNGGPQNPAEPLMFQPDATEANCDSADGDDLTSELGRGNIQIHEAKADDGS